MSEILEYLPYYNEGAQNFRMKHHLVFAVLILVVCGECLSAHFLKTTNCLLIFTPSMEIPYLPTTLVLKFKLVHSTTF